jgi:predicted phage terminase large subunit-like protein
MQRLHEEDVAGWLLKGGNGEKWEHISLPAIKTDGTALWAEKHTIEKLKEMQAAASYVFAGQYMQNPAPLGGGLIKSEWFKRYAILPILEERNIYADTAMKTASHNDYSVLQCWGKTDGRLYLIDQLRGKWEASELKQRTLDFWLKHSNENVKTHGFLRRLYVEDKASGTGLIQDIAKTGKIPIKDIQRAKDKLTRLMDVQGYIESGLLHLPNEPWVSDFLSECESFTPNDTHLHDDQIDPMCDAITTMLVKRKGGYFANQFF